MQFTSCTDLDSLPEGVDALFARAARSSLFLSRNWFETLLDHSPTGHDKLLFACVHRDKTVLAMLPCVRNSPSDATALRHRYTALYAPLLADEERTQALDCLATGLRELGLTSLLLEPVDADDGDVRDFQAAMSAAGFTCQTHFRFFNWIHRVDSQPFDAYLAARPTRVRNSIARKQRKLEREHACVMRMYLGDAIADAMAQYNAVYRSSWKANEQYGEFLDALAIGLAEPDWTRLGILTIDQQPAAAQLWFVAHRRASIFRLAYDERWKMYSPGSLLTRFMMQQAIDVDRVDDIDFLTGNEAYKQDWMTLRRERVALSCVREHKPRSGLRSRLASLLGSRGTRTR